MVTAISRQSEKLNMEISRFHSIVSQNSSLSNPGKEELTMASEATMTDVHERAKHLTAWLNTVTRNLIIDWIRERGGIDFISLYEPVDIGEDGESVTWEDLIPAPVKTKDKPMDPRVKKQLEAIEQALPQIAPLQEFVVIQAYYNGLKDKEIAEVLRQDPELRQKLGLRQEPKKENIKKTRYQARRNLKRLCGVESTDNE